MINSMLVCGCLDATITEICRQDVEFWKFLRWLKHGYDSKGRVIPFDTFWSK